MFVYIKGTLVSKRPVNLYLLNGIYDITTISACLIRFSIVIRPLLGRVAISNIY